ncbi:hypothetical protein BC936DRAFT_148066 [Jimgerdemannia flammicorona]|uniref:Permease family-domain-containing protein n=1 Tax=Jimgerdemannia flammicorona TaxID=994334 RepID=A0A433DKQ2_9FUNG|nr:hypothetical protein BC936DRAFT_148066 [Jimgerdemannia flammicorona]
MDTTGTLYSMAKFGGFLDKNGDFDGSTLAFMCDAISISIGAIFGTSPCTTFIESGAGITEGGRTGITAITTAFCFFISLFFAPIFASLPPWATGPALILIGSLMMASAKNINWEYIGDSVPAFLTMALIPLTYSIAYGVIAGIVAYVLINGSALFIEKASFGRITHDNSKRETWWSGLAGVGIVPIWIKIVAAKAQGKEYKHEEEDETDESIGSFKQMETEKGVEELPVAVRITE